jgi:hypothetical protein
MRITGIDHVQLAMPAGQEEIAREFYTRTLGIPEVPKPPELAKRGGAWFEGYTRVHVSDPFGNRIELLQAQPD